jgi:hypothetical protein
MSTKQLTLLEPSLPELTDALPRVDRWDEPVEQRGVRFELGSDPSTNYAGVLT